MAALNRSIRYNTDINFWQYDSSVAQDGSAWTTLPVDGTLIAYVGSGYIPWAFVSKSGSSLADLATRSAGDLNSGTLADGRLSSNVSLKNAIATISAVYTFSTNPVFNAAAIADSYLTSNVPLKNAIATIGAVYTFSSNPVFNAAAIADSYLSSNIPLKNAASAITGAWTFDSTTLVIDTTNHRVGIGTASPGFQLSVSNTTNGPKISLNGSAVCGVRLQSTDPSAGDRNWTIQNNSDISGGLSFLYGASQTAAPGTVAIIFDNAGNIFHGGATNPASATNAIILKNGTAPSVGVAGQGILYVESGILKYRGSAGTITTLGVA